MVWERCERRTGQIIQDGQRRRFDGREMAVCAQWYPASCIRSCGPKATSADGGYTAMTAHDACQYL